MTTVTEQPATVADPAEGEAGPDRGKTALGRTLDVAGVVAACVLGVILFDVFSGGKLTRWVQQRRQPGPEQPPQPCEDC